MELLPDEGDVRTRRADRGRGARRRRRRCALLRLDRVVAEVESTGRVARRFRRSRKAATASMLTARRPRSTSSQIRSARPRYGFVSHYGRGPGGDGVTDNVRALSPERRAVLRLDVPPREADAAGGRVRRRARPARSRSTPSRRLAAAVREAGSLPMAYAAVYAVGKEAWPEWEPDGLFRARRLAVDARRLPLERRPDRRALGRALLGRPARDAARSGSRASTSTSTASPKRALPARTGRMVDLVEAFPALIDRVAADVPEARTDLQQRQRLPDAARPCAQRRRSPTSRSGRRTERLGHWRSS